MADASACNLGEYKEGCPCKHCQALLNEHGKFFKSLQLGAAMAKIAAKSDVLRMANQQTRPLDGMAELPDEVLVNFWKGAMPELIQRTRNALEGMKATMAHQSTHNKFSDFSLGPLEVFYRGMDGMIGLPQLKFLKAMKEEHDSEEEFCAYNQGRTIISSPAKEWARVLPPEMKGKINNKDWDGTEMCSDFETHPRAKAAELRKEELIAIRLYSGPMYMKYNGKLRQAGAKLIQALAAQGEQRDVEGAMQQVRSEMGEEYVTTLHTLVSALIKLSQNAQALPSKAYRGVHDMKPPACFTDPIAPGGVEFGFLSTTLDMNTAISYATSGGRPMIFEIECGMVDHGASIGWISYFPGEAEVLLPPLCMLQVSGGERFERTPDTREGKGVWVTVFPLKLNLNLQSCTLDELMERRKRLHLSMTKNLIAEVERDLQGEFEMGLHWDKRSAAAEDAASHATILPSVVTWAPARSRRSIAQLPSVVTWFSAERRSVPVPPSVGTWHLHPPVVPLLVDAAAEELRAKRHAKRVLLRQCEDVLQRHQAQDVAYFNDEDNYKQALDESMLVKRFAMLRFTTLSRHFPRVGDTPAEAGRKKRLAATIENTPVSMLQHDAWRYAELSGAAWTLSLRDGLVCTRGIQSGAAEAESEGGAHAPLWKLLCSRRPAPLLRIAPKDVTEEELAVLVDCMADYSTGLRTIEFGTLTISLKGETSRFLDLGFGSEAAERGQEQLRVTHAACFGEDESRFVAALLRRHPAARALDLSNSRMRRLHSKLTGALLDRERGAPRELRSLSLAHCALEAPALAFIAHYIQANSALTSLQLAGNAVSAEGCALVARALAARAEHAERGSLMTLDGLELPLGQPRWDIPGLQLIGPRRVQLLAAVVRHQTQLVALNALQPPLAKEEAWDLRTQLGLEGASEGESERERERADRGWASIEIPLAFVCSLPVDVIRQIDLSGTTQRWGEEEEEEEGGSTDRMHCTKVLRIAMQEWVEADAAGYLGLKLADVQHPEWCTTHYGPELLELARLGHKVGVRKLVCAWGKRGDHTYTDASGKGALAWAAQCGSPWFLKTGFNVQAHAALARFLRAPDVRDRTGRVIFRAEPEATEAKAKAQAPADATTRRKSWVDANEAPTTRDRAKTDFPETVQLLLNNAVDATVKAGETSALLTAAQSGNTEVLKLILQVPHAAVAEPPPSQKPDDPQLEPSAEQPPLSVSGARGGDRHPTAVADSEALVCAAAGGHMGAVSLLLDQGVHVDGRHGDVVTLPLQAAEPEIFTAFRVRSEVTEKYKQPTALLMASATGNASLVELLLRRRADVNQYCSILLSDNSAKDGKGIWTPLVIASAAGHTRVVELLLGAAQSMEPTQKHEALERAAAKGHFSIATALRNHGADSHHCPWWFVAIEKASAAPTVQERLGSMLKFVTPAPGLDDSTAGDGEEEENK